MKSLKILWIFILLWLTLVSCWKNKDENESKTESGNITTTSIDSNNVEPKTEVNLNSNSWEVMSNKTIVSKGDKISVHYTWTLEDGSKFDSSRDPGRTPLEFTVWAGQMIPWFDAWVVDMKLWEKKIINIEPKDAYGEYDPKKIQIIPKKDLESFTKAWIILEKGSKLPTQMWELNIIDADKESITLDVNHKLAWKKLIFDVEIMSIK